MSDSQLSSNQYSIDNSSAAQEPTNATLVSDGQSNATVGGHRSFADFLSKLGSLTLDTLSYVTGIGGRKAEPDLFDMLGDPAFELCPEHLVKNGKKSEWDEFVSEMRGMYRAKKVGSIWHDSSPESPWWSETKKEYFGKTFWIGFRPFGKAQRYIRVFFHIKIDPEGHILQSGLEMLHPVHEILDLQLKSSKEETGQQPTTSDVLGEFGRVVACSVSSSVPDWPVISNGDESACWFHVTGNPYVDGNSAVEYMMYGLMDTSKFPA